MRFSMNSYLLGVGTVVGALAFGFGGGILLTKTAIKDSPAGPSRIERVARPEPASPQVQVTEAKAVPVPRADPAPAVQPAPDPAPQVQAAAEPKPAPDARPVAEAARPEPAKAAEPVRQVECAKAGGEAGGAAGQTGRRAEANRAKRSRPGDDRARTAQGRARAAPRRTPDGARAVLCRTQGEDGGICEDQGSARSKSRSSRHGPNSPSNARSRSRRICSKACSGGPPKRRQASGSDRALDGALAPRHCEERSDEAIQTLPVALWIASLRSQ